MTNEEKLLFEALTAKRKSIADALESPCVEGLANTAEEKYTDQAHFVYELIQNADDALATEARFILEKERVIFIHNGTKRFSITDVENEKHDSINGTLGHINGITSYANSTKIRGNSIGRFGLGFKAVLQYTVSPYIYDPNFSFKIVRKIVPELVDGDYEYRKKNETAFILPFNHPERDAKIAYEDIEHKLQNLVNPMLFLKNLKIVSYQYGDRTGIYRKNVIDEEIIPNTEAKLLNLENGSKNDNEKVWMFTRKTENNRKYSVGFYMDEKDHLIAKNYYAFCFFPTKKQTNLGFIINAPFLLNDSREGIKAACEYNDTMIRLLAELAADCFVYLRDISLIRGGNYIDDDILNLIPYKKELYVPNDIRSDISLLPFYEEIEKVLKTEKLLPSFNEHAYADKAYMAYAPVISEIFSNEQLSELTGVKDSKWVFVSKGWESIYRTRDGRADYLRDVIANQYIIDTKILDSLTSEFIENQSLDWLIRLYTFICDTDNRVKVCRYAPVFLDKNGKAVAAFDNDDNAILFLDDEDSYGYETILPELMQYEETKKMIQRMGIKTPELKDKIYNKILKKEELNPKADFRAFLDYYIELVESGNDNIQKFINDIKHKSFIFSKSEDGISKGVLEASKIYIPSDDLKFYFEGCGDEAWFVDVEEYFKYLNKKELKYLEEFLCKLGTHTHVMVRCWVYDYDSVVENFGEDWPRATSYKEWNDYAIDNDEQVIARIEDNKDIKLSSLLWRELVFIYETEKQMPILGGVYKYFFRYDNYALFEGFCVRLLRNSSWIFDRQGVLRKPNELSVQDLANNYDVSTPGAKKLIKMLNIMEKHPEYEKLDDVVREKLEVYDLFASTGIFDLSQEKVQKLMKMIDDMEGDRYSYEENLDDNSTYVSEESSEEKVIKDITERVKKSKNKDKNEKKSEEYNNEADSDDIIKAPVDYSKKIEQTKQKFEEEISRLAQIEEAHNKADKSKIYSYAWFISLLQLESMANGDENANSREVSISFSSVEREAGTNRILILRHPDKNIPQIMEELVDIPMDLTFRDGQIKRLIIEVANVQSYTLRVKIKQDDFIHDIDFSEVTQALIVAQSPSFLTRELQKEFSKFGKYPYNFDDDYDMRENLCENIKFIFGPPGTGKTTYLAKETLLPIVQKEQKVRILVLTPTNKAADVLVSRIMQIMVDDMSYENWLVRYGVTLDEKIEKSAVFHGKDFEINDYEKCVVVTTMARLPYDYFIDSMGRFNYLHGINWDYIVVDEASMIPLVQMIYLLYLKTPKQFIVAGDPFQIEPTTIVSDWKTENIYKMINLQEFSENAETIPHKYEIKLLTKQYRSVESIGEVFSRLTYNGVLTHARENEDARPLNIERYLDYQNLNIIKFPVSSFESIYRAKRLKLSSYQVYSALFVYEFSTYLAKAIARENNKDEKFKIGIIAPYGAQAGVIDKLIASANIPDNIELTSGTIHGFQGDECDIIIALFNPPPKISTNRDMFLNKQNIINVAISRARDYLFVFVPNDDTENIQNLWLINKLKKLIENDFHSESDTKKLEKIIFDDENYLEKNTFSTGHQLVNVYGLPEKRYEIRSEDNAIDVQVYGSAYYAPFAETDLDD